MQIKRKHLVSICAVLTVFLCVEAVSAFALYESGLGGSYKKNLNLGHQYLLNEDYENAIKAFSEAIDINPRSEAYIALGDAYIGVADYEKAWDSYEKAQELDDTLNVLEEKFGQTEISIQDQDGEPVEGARIELTKANGKGESLTIQTGEEGIVSEVICPGNYNMKVSKDNYFDTEESIDILFHEVDLEPIEIVAEGSQWVLVSEKLTLSGGMSNWVYYFYDDKGNVISKKSENYYPEYNKTSTYEYDDYRIIEKVYNNSGFFSEIITELNGYGEPTKISTTYDDGAIYTKEYEYDDDMLAKEKSYSGMQLAEEIEYTYEQGVLIFASVIDHNGNGTYNASYSYDENGNLIEIYEENGGSLFRQTTYTYNALGKIEMEYYLYGPMTREREYSNYRRKYEYDSNGNLIRCSELGYDSDYVAAVTDYTYARLSDAIAAQT